MQLTQIEITNFRNIHQARLKPHPRFNILAGPNGAGKSNLLEALYVAGSVKSFRPGRNQELIRLGEQSAGVQATIELGGLSRQIKLDVTNRRKRYTVNDKAITSFADYLGTLVTVIFTPAELFLLRGQASERRRYLDRVVCGVQPAHLLDLQDYALTLKSRNQVLKDARIDKLLLGVYTDQLIPMAARITDRRIRVLDEMSDRFVEVFRQVFSKDSLLKCQYRATDWPDPGGSGVPALEARLRESLDKSALRERSVGHTMVGPHRDDIEITLDGLAAREYASQGQMRAIVLTLKMSEINYLQEKCGVCPVLLLDDVSSELDRGRNQQLFEFINEMKAQTWITTTDRSYIQLQDEYKCFQVDLGEVSLIDG